jgi:MFS family permease
MDALESLRQLSAYKRPVLNRAITALGITQIVGWGTTYYAPTVLAAGMAKDTGWSLTLVFAAFSWSTVVSALVSKRLGQLFDRRGARGLMSAGSVLVAIGQLTLATAHHWLQLFAAWTLLGLAMRLVLYEASFVAIARIAGERARRAISLLTLWGGLASTVFWPLGHWMGEAVGWRWTMAAYAALQLLVCLPLHWRYAGPRGTSDGPDQSPAKPASATTSAPSSAPTNASTGAAQSAPSAAPPAGVAAAIPGDPTHGTDPAWRERAIVLLSVVLAANMLVFASLSAHLVTVLQGVGLTAAAAVALASLKGIAQTAARFVELAAQRWLGPIGVGVIATALLPLALVALEFVPPLVVPVAICCALYGASNGLMTIVRGAVPLALFGRESYGAVLGRLAAPGLIAAALAPTLFAWIVEAVGVRAALLALIAASVASFAGMLVLAHGGRRVAR